LRCSGLTTRENKQEKRKSIYDWQTSEKLCFPAWLPQMFGYLHPSISKKYHQSPRDGGRDRNHATPFPIPKEQVTSLPHCSILKSLSAETFKVRGHWACSHCPSKTVTSLWKHFLLPATHGHISV
jgi:hypothetical protein